MSDELPKLFSDEEFNAQRVLRERREIADRRTHDRRAAPKPIILTDGLPESTIEQRFPHIAKKLISVWRSEACAVYISSLSVADRPGRQGFPAQVMEDLMMLHGINEMVMEQSPVEKAAAPLPAWKETGRRERE